MTRGEDQISNHKIGGAVTVPRRHRLKAMEVDILPWVRAVAIEDIYLYWMPVSDFPPTHSERVWLLEFMERFSQRLASEHELRGELFFQFKTASEHASESFRAYSLKCQTLLGLSRKPGASLPKVPTLEQLKKASEEGKPFDLNQWVGDFCYWFRSKRPIEQREMFAGFGGLTTIFLAPDPKTAPPKLPFTPAFRDAMPVFKVFDVDALVEGAYALQDSFLPKSKEIFGVGLEDKPEYPGIMYIIPLLESGHFFAVPPEERERWFGLFDVYINESPSDGGMVLAFKKDYEDLLMEVVGAMRTDGLVYPSTGSDRDGR